MAFLIEDDYKVQVRTEIKSILINADAGTQAQAELAAQAEMESYLVVRYNVGEIFEAEEQERNPLIIMYLIDMVLYHMHSNISPRNIPELRLDRYDQAIKWLTMVSKGQLNPSLPLLPEGESIVFKGGSNKKTSRHW